MRREPFARNVLPLAVLLAATLLAGCETTAQKSARIEKQNRSKIANDKGVVVTKSDPKVSASKPVVLTDDYGQAAVVELRSKDRRAIQRPPVQLVVKDAKGEKAFQNDTPGLDPALTSVAVLPAGATGYFIYDQLDVEGKRLKSRAKVGAGKRLAASTKLPRFSITGLEFESDAEGYTITGKVANKSKIDQRRLVLYGIGKRGGEIVSAGTAQLERLNAGKRAGFQMFFIGDPRGLKIRFFVPPTAVK